MNASKENARQALDVLGQVKKFGLNETYEAYLKEFLRAAERKLPSEAAYRREKARAGG